MTILSSSSNEQYDPLVGRLRVMTFARVFALLATMLALAVAQGGQSNLDTLITSTTLVYASLGYLMLNGVVLLVIRYAGQWTRVLNNVALVGDAVWAGTLLWFTGRTGSAFIFIMYILLVAATVLFSWQTGVKLAILFTLSLAANAYGQSVGLASSTEADLTLGLFGVSLDTSFAGGVALTQWVWSMVTLWITAGATAYFSSVNERELRQSNNELAVLRDLTSQLERSLDLGDVCQAIAEGVVRDLGYSRAILWLAQTGNDLVPAGAHGFAGDGQELLSDLKLVVGPGPVGRAVENRRPVLVSREHARPTALADAFDIDSPLVVVPLMSEARTLGLLTAEVGQPLARAPRVRGRDLRILGTVATEASLALDNARLHQELRDLSVTDALTGVYNHRYFQQRLQEELDRSIRKASSDGRPAPVSLILKDVDLFKKVNDRFGHQSGDELLRAIARLTQRVLRSTDVVCRYGGEEFAVILPDTNRDQAVQVAERLREAIERSTFTGVEGRYLGQVTASFGISTHETGVPSRSEIIRQADEALYDAKETGRNRVVFSEPESGPSRAA